LKLCAGISSQRLHLSNDEPKMAGNPEITLTEVDSG
jgi:hypothetical protein